MAGRVMSEKEYNARIDSVIDGSCFQKYLHNKLRQKEETQNKLAGLEETEQMLRTIIIEVERRKTS